MLCSAALAHILLCNLSIQFVAQSICGTMQSQLAVCYAVQYQLSFAVHAISACSLLCSAVPAFICCTCSLSLQFAMQCSTSFHLLYMQSQFAVCYALQSELTVCCPMLSAFSCCKMQPGWLEYALVPPANIFELASFLMKCREVGWGVRDAGWKHKWRVPIQRLL